MDSYLVRSKQGQTGGLITGLVFGVAGLVIGVIIALLIVSTLNNAGLFSGTSTTVTQTNESITMAATVNAGGIGTITAASNVNFVTWNISLPTVINRTIDAEGIGVGILTEGSDYQIFLGNGSILNLTSWNATFITYDWNRNVNIEGDTVGNLSGNLSAGIDNVSEQIPTVLLIAAIVLILTVLAVLVLVWQRMRLGGTGAI